MPRLGKFNPLVPCAVTIEGLLQPVLPQTVPSTRSPQESEQIRRLMLFFAVVFVVEGIGQARVGILAQPLTYYLKQLGWAPLEVTAYLALLNFPWIIKPAFGLVSDFIPLFGYRRKTYLLVTNAGAVAAYVWIARLTEPGVFAGALLFTTDQRPLIGGEQAFWTKMASCASIHSLRDNFPLTPAFKPRKQLKLMRRDARPSGALRRTVGREVTSGVAGCGSAPTASMPWPT